MRTPHQPSLGYPASRSPATSVPTDDAAVGYENQAFFRRLFRRSTGLTPGQYRRMFRPIPTATMPAPAQPAAA